jgi:hypothetical protein
MRFTPVTNYSFRKDLVSAQTQTAREMETKSVIATFLGTILSVKLRDFPGKLYCFISGIPKLC